MELGWVLAWTAPITAFLMFHQCLALVRRHHENEAETGGAFMLFTCLYIITAIGLLFSST